MDFLFIALTVLGLSLFEMISSIDNAVINAEVLSGVSKKMKKWFLGWGFLISVLVVRGLLPFVIVWISNPSLSPLKLLQTVGTSPQVSLALEKSAPLLLIGGGTFLVFLFFHWLFLEPKNFGLFGERFFQSQGAWFFTVASVLLSVLVWFALKTSALLGFSAVLGSTAFFIIHGFRSYAQDQEKKLLSGGLEDMAKIAYLEVLDASFSIDGVVGAFAFTLSIPVILLGNGLGAFILRHLTVSNIDRIKKYKYLKNGAMYSILFLGVVMILEAFGIHIKSWVSPVITFATVGYFFLKSKKEVT